MSTDAALNALIVELEAELGEETLAQARYQERVRVAQFLTGLVMPALLALLWLPTGAAVALRDWLHGNVSWWGTWAVLLVFLLSEVVLGFPLTWYFGFHVENRLGTNRQSFGGWLLDELKQSVLNLPLQSLLFLGLYFVFRRWPDRWLGGISLVVVLFLGVFYLLQPVFLRLRFKAEPLDAPELEARVRALFEQTGQAFHRLSVLRASEKTARGNAALVPRGAGTEVVVLDTLLDALRPEAIEAVIAHELGHKVHRDLLRLMIFLGAALSLALAGGYQILQRWGYGGGLQGPGDVAAFPLLGWVIGWLSAALQIALNAISRRIEAAADRFSLALTGKPEAFEEAMRVLARQNKALPQPAPWVERLLYNHPGLARRILVARRWRPAALKSATQARR